MTDNEIIKALECHNLCTVSKCEECPLFPTNECSAELSGYALDFINRQKAEIEGSRQRDFVYFERNKSLAETVKTLETRLCHARAEAIKEFAERLKADFEKPCAYDFVCIERRIDNLVKEMVGDTE